MKKYFNWGTGILIVIVIFFISVIVRILISLTIPVDLISPDYYHKELNYEQQIQKKKNVNNLEEKVKMTVSSDKITLVYPEIFKNKVVTGEVLFYCPSKLDNDIKQIIEFDDSLKQFFEKTDFSEKRYFVQINWQADSIFYYQEIELNL